MTYGPTGDLKDYLSRVEDLNRFEEITPVKIVDAPEGKYALFYAYLKPGRNKISIKWYYQFEMPRIRFEAGWEDYGMRRADEILKDDSTAPQ
ncbi:hypothetical protein CW705_08925 [Candidatus Bathyarchaeota archaeon]|nr:MAG: hypothetical protein CW705_08925 [Candidatus Bathyarchaeota archaeon]